MSETLMTTEYLRLISGSQVLSIAPTDGTQTIARTARLFTGGISPKFVGWGLDIEGESTGLVNVQVHEMVNPGNFENIFRSKGLNLHNLSMTQSQIILFVKKHYDWLRADERATFFLLNVGNMFFVVHVGIFVGHRPWADVSYLATKRIWNADFHHRFVLPVWC